ncbi:hypothetical protein Btru_077888 [Bulinus truncatus]|nr:hypothetical protein Btru_077888 [Bulinus truncatus]
MTRGPKRQVTQISTQLPNIMKMSPCLLVIFAALILATAARNSKNSQEFKGVRPNDRSSRDDRPYETFNVLGITYKPARRLDQSSETADNDDLTGESSESNQGSADTTRGIIPLDVSFEESDETSSVPYLAVEDPSLLGNNDK